MDKQVAFKPLTLEGLPESFIAALQDGRNLDWKKSLMGIIQSSLAHGPVHFDVYPNLVYLCQMLIYWKP